MNMKLGEIIVEKRKQANLTQQDLANKLGVSNTAVSKWENDINYPDISLIQPLCKILNIDIIKLLNIEKKRSFNIFKCLTIILTIVLLAVSISFYLTSIKEPSYEVSKVSIDNQLYTIDGLIIKKNNTNNILIYNIIENDGILGTNKEQTLDNISVIINNDNKYVFSNSNNLLSEINNTIIYSEGIIEDIKLEMTYLDKTNLAKKEKITLNIEDFE